MNDDASGNQIDVKCSLKDSEPFKKQYAAVLVQLNEANEQVFLSIQETGSLYIVGFHLSKKFINFLS